MKWVEWNLESSSSTLCLSEALFGALDVAGKQNIDNFVYRGVKCDNHKVQLFVTINFTN